MHKLIKYTEILKHLPRTGWLVYEINTPETVASHSWQMAMMAIQLSNKLIYEEYDFGKIIKMCLCHDLGESLIGDITPKDKRYKNKDDKENAAIEHIAEEGDMLELISLYNEYRENKTPEAKLTHDLDKLDMYAQAICYEHQYPDKDLSEFKISAERNIQTNLGREILKDLSEM